MLLLREFFSANVVDAVSRAELPVLFILDIAVDAGATLCLQML